MLTAEGTEDDLRVYTDAGFAGAATQSQNGLVICWGGSIITWRSSRAALSALSTAEAELCAAALGWQVTEGVRYLLSTLQIYPKNVEVLIDNQAALTAASLGATWRTRYYAVRASRLLEEGRLGRASLKHCPTKQMVADAMTKLATPDVIEVLIQAMEGKLPSASVPIRTSVSTGPQNRGDMAGDGPPRGRPRTPRHLQPWNIPGTGSARNKTGANTIEVSWTPPNPTSTSMNEHTAEPAEPDDSNLLQRGPAGRGKGSTLPAWMTQSNTSQSTSTSTPNTKRYPLLAAEVITPAGRGKSMTRPAWMSTSTTTSNPLLTPEESNELEASKRRRAQEPATEAMAGRVPRGSVGMAGAGKGKDAPALGDKGKGKEAPAQAGKGKSKSKSKDKEAPAPAGKGKRGSADEAAEAAKKAEEEDDARPLVPAAPPWQSAGLPLQSKLGEKACPGGGKAKGKGTGKKGEVIDVWALVPPPVPSATAAGSGERAPKPAGFRGAPPPKAAAVKPIAAGQPQQPRQPRQLQQPQQPPQQRQQQLQQDDVKSAPWRSAAKAAEAAMKAKQERIAAEAAAAALRAEEERLAAEAAAALQAEEEHLAAEADAELKAEEKRLAAEAAAEAARKAEEDRLAIEAAELAVAAEVAEAAWAADAAEAAAVEEPWWEEAVPLLPPWKRRRRGRPRCRPGKAEREVLRAEAAWREAHADDEAAWPEAYAEAEGEEDAPAEGEGEEEG